jgi:hypothetical protein
LIEISIEIGMLNFLGGIIGHCTEGRISLSLTEINIKVINGHGVLCRVVPCI